MDSIVSSVNSKVDAAIRDPLDPLVFQIRDVIVKLTESLDDFYDRHCHYNNEVHRTTTEVSETLLRIVQKNYVEIAPDQISPHHKWSFKTTSLDYSTQDQALYYWQNNGKYGSESQKKIFLFKGNYERREYFSFINLQGVAWKSFRPHRGIVCPAMLCDVDEDGTLTDSGHRLWRIWLTRCLTPQLWGLIYSTITKEFQLTKDLSRDIGKRVTVTCIPYETDNIIV